MASIKRRETASGVRWDLRYWAPNGKRVRKTFRSEREAQRFGNVVESDKLRGEWADPSAGRSSVAELARDWQVRHEPSWRGSTRSSYRSILKCHVVPHLGEHQVGRFAESDVDAWMATMRSSGVSPSTVANSLRLLRMILDDAVRDRRGVVRNVARGVTRPRVVRRTHRFLDAREVARLADTIHPAYRALVIVGAYGGPRIGEMFGLRRRNVDVAGGRIIIAEQSTEVDGHVLVGQPVKSASSRRSIALPAFVIAELETHMRTKCALGPDAFVFPSLEGHPMRRQTFYRLYWRPALERAELVGLRVHDLRHTAVAFAIGTGANAKAVQSRFGHASIQVTYGTYGHLFPGQDEAIAAALDGMSTGAVIPLRRAAAER